MLLIQPTGFFSDTGCKSVIAKESEGNQSTLNRSKTTSDKTVSDKQLTDQAIRGRCKRKLSGTGYVFYYIFTLLYYMLAWLYAWLHLSLWYVCLFWTSEYSSFQLNNVFV